MSKAAPSLWDELATPAQREQFAKLARRRNWSVSLALVGWLHLLAFGVCYYLTLVQDYHDAPGYLVIWGIELCGIGLIFRFCGGPRENEPAPPLARFVYRVWIAYFVLAFNICTMTTLRGHLRFELFPAMASLASFGFLTMTFAVSRRFFAAVLVMFAAGLLMSASALHAYLFFAVAWWLVLHGIGLALWLQRRSPSTTAPPSTNRVSGSVPTEAQEAARPVSTCTS